MARSYRDEFKRKVRELVIKRANGACEKCGAALKLREGEIDHILPVELSGKPTADNAQLLCKPCHKNKTADNIRQVRKSDRQRDKHTGAMRSSAEIPNRPFPSSPKANSRERRRRDRDALAALAAKIRPELARPIERRTP